MSVLKITMLSILGVSALGLAQAGTAQSNQAKLAAARACDGNQWQIKGYNSYQECTADYINYYPNTPPSQEPL